MDSPLLLALGLLYCHQLYFRDHGKTHREKTATHLSGELEVQKGMSIFLVCSFSSEKLAHRVI
jgi:hypothetical protein